MRNLKLRTFLPLLTYPDAASASSIDDALALSKFLGADLDAVAIEVEIPAVSNALSRTLLNVPEMIRNARTLSAQNGSGLLEAAGAKGEAAGVAVRMQTIRSTSELVCDTAAERARYGDIALVGLEPSNPGTRLLAEAVIFGAGRPTVLLPAGRSSGRSSGKIGRVTIAWDGSRVAARAVADARPLLELASAVNIVTVIDEKLLKHQGAGKHLAEILGLGGSSAQFETISAKGRPIAAALQGHAIETGADLLVMGGYGHSRLRDFVLGGATRGVLANLELPVLLSH